MELDLIETCFENGSPLQWETDPDGRIHIGLLYDYERGSPNRAAGHWHFQLRAAAGSDLNLTIGNFDNIWNGRPGSPISDRTSCFVSLTGRTWRAIPARKTADNRLELSVHMDGSALYLARLEPYRVKDLERLLSRIGQHALVEIQPIGQTVEGRSLEMVRLGSPDAPKRVLVRARSHAWAPGGSWVAQGLIRGLLEESNSNRAYFDKICVYVFPMAEKDGVVRGRTRFNSHGMDLNRGWEHLADSSLSPENAALESWLQLLSRGGIAPQLAIDLHNDNSGKLHVSRPATTGDRHVVRMARLDQLLRRHTWFTEGSQYGNPAAPWTMGEGLLERYRIDACILELNCDWIACLGKVPFGADWERFGRGLVRVFAEYFDGDGR